jgi:hypothetical protein
MLTVKQLREWLSEFHDDMEVKAVDFKTNKVASVDLMVEWEDLSGKVISTMGIE